jgi:hypothetical protein
VAIVVPKTLPVRATLPLVTTRLPGLAATVVAALLVAGCGNGGTRIPSLGGLPLAAGSRVSVRERVCDPGENAFCALELVVQSHEFKTSSNLLGAESLLLRQRGWRRANAPTGLERAADSPRGRLRVTYATAADDLESIELGWVHRSHTVALALSRALIARRSTLSVLLEVGTG